MPLRWVRRGTFCRCVLALDRGRFIATTTAVVIAATFDLAHATGDDNQRNETGHSHRSLPRVESEIEQKIVRV